MEQRAPLADQLHTVVYLLIVRRVECELDRLGLADGRRDGLPLAPAQIGYLDGRRRRCSHLQKSLVLWGVSLRVRLPSVSSLQNQVGIGLPA